MLAVVLLLITVVVLLSVAGLVGAAWGRLPKANAEQVVELFARFGNAEGIKVQGKPHVGSDVLPAAVSAMREELGDVLLQVVLHAQIGRASCRERV